MEPITLVVALLLGLIVGAVAGWAIRHARAAAEIARLTGQLEQTATAQQLLDSAQAQFSETAKLTAAEALQGNNDQFLKLANENLGKTLESASRELDRRHQQFQELVKPLSENYVKLNPKIDDLTKATADLSASWNNVKQVGNWGEVQLRRVVEMANMTDYSDFTEQSTTGASQERPDLIVRLPEGRTIVVDAKASIAAALEAQASEDEVSANAAWEKHAGALKAQVNNLSRKNYGSTPGSLNFVVMFVPGDQFLSAALKFDHDLLAYAMQRRIALATPASLIAMLWAINSGWQQSELDRNAEEIRKIGSEMHDRLQKFTNHYGSVQKRLKQTVEAFNESVGALEGRVLVSARRMAEMQAKDPSDIRELGQIEAAPRRPLAATDDNDKLATH